MYIEYTYSTLIFFFKKGHGEKKASNINNSNLSDDKLKRLIRQIIQIGEGNQKLLVIIVITCQLKNKLINLIPHYCRLCSASNLTIFGQHLSSPEFCQFRPDIFLFVCFVCTLFFLEKNKFNLFFRILFVYLLVLMFLIVLLQFYLNIFEKNRITIKWHQPFFFLKIGSFFVICGSFLIFFEPIFLKKPLFVKKKISKSVRWGGCSSSFFMLFFVIHNGTKNHKSAIDPIIKNHNSDYLAKRIYFFTTTDKKEIVQDINEKLYCVALDYDNELKTIPYASQWSNATGKAFSVEIHHKTIDKAEAGDNVGVNVKKLKKENMPHTGDMMCIDGPAVDHSPPKHAIKFTAFIHIRTAKAPCHMLEIKWKMGKATYNAKVEGATFIEASDQAEVVFAPKMPLVVTSLDESKPLARIVRRFFPHRFSVAARMAGINTQNAKDDTPTNMNDGLCSLSNFLDNCCQSYCKCYNAKFYYVFPCACILQR
ncbi:hypothetical protein RFI_07774 [Reticulomyxa filosa]|uniref:GTP-eEF1A C-terminal domain-containing protein n=1 Tax=Reticulomyxa filosa TaxID=46433 RepID=X6NST7_RETFI|nr:hypothetical protein RFI_07774 [Reticulomyxa filosa]|eukprot:ETO29350.1 hypothetical protein RFI_07774 [Reticulomyxa filosa]